MPGDEQEGQGYDWYVRRGGKIHGPYPEGIIGSYLILGRITTDDEISHDRQHWLPLASYPELLPDIFADDDIDPDQLMAARRWHDERRYLDRRMSEDTLPKRSERRRNADRREASADEARRRRMTPVFDAEQDSRRRQKDRRRSLVAGIVVLTVITFAFIWQQNSDQQINDEDRDCSAQAAPGVNWNHCQFQNALLADADLTAARLYNINLQSARLMAAKFVDADLSYANLNGADLRGSDLHRAQLIGADLQNADLRGSKFWRANLLYADLRGAKIDDIELDGAQLGHAIWTDGRLCASASIGRCMNEPKPTLENR